jgi:small subunit ribosomal protein S16
MLKIKLARKGKKNRPFFRLIVQEDYKDPFADYVECVGYWDPISKKGDFKKERILYWLNKGAKLTPSVNNLLINQGIIEGKKIKVTKVHKKKEETSEKK